MAVIITPDDGNAAEIGKQLLALADHYGDVQWVSWPTAGYRVSEELAVKLKNVRALPDAEPAQETAEDVSPATVAADTDEQPSRRRTGRPRRTVSVDAPVFNTDDTAKEE